MIFDQVKEITIAALLHDVGKVVQRAQENPRAMTHSEWGAKWLAKYFSKNSKTVFAAAYHHAGTELWDQSNFTLLIYQADNWASSERDKKSDKDPNYEWDAEAPLATPFSRISLKEKKARYPACWPAHELAPLPPLVAEEPEKVSCKDYQRLLFAFENDFSKLAKGDLHPDTLLMFLEKYFSFIPSETLVPKEGFEKWPDISLFDHLKLTAAIASSYYLWLAEKYGSEFTENKRLFKEEICYPASTEKPFLLVGGDISGVQKFIYTISSKGALKSLKGRSFFLELLTEHAAKRILDTVGLYRCNLIFAGGGHFYLLLPNIEKTLQQIETISSELNNWLVNQFSGALEIHICYESFHPDVFTRRAGHLFQKVSQKFEESKKRPFLQYLDKLLSEPLPLHESCFAGAGSPGSCSVCFRDDVEIKPHDGLELCNACREQLELGKNIQKCAGKKKFLFEHFLLCQLDEGIEIEDKKYQLSNKLVNKPLYLWSVNHFSSQGNAFIPSGLYQGIFEFEQLKEDKSFGLPRIAALRMDVDNLGQIFREGLADEDQTFSRLAAISRALNLFFKYHLNALLCGERIGGFSYPAALEPYDWAGRNVREDGRNVAIIYSGGDDLFLMGHWLDICEAAFDILKAFQVYTGNPELTISGGIVMGHIKIPVYQYAELAGKAENRAKRHRKEKNSLFLFGKAIRNEEIDEVKNILALFSSFLENQTTYMAIKEEGLSRSFFYRIFNSAREFLDEDNKDRILVLPRIAYLLARAKKNISGEYYIKLQNYLLSLDEETWKKIFISAQWVIMSMRGGGRNE